LFFFSSRRRYTRWPRDWSSDVCSSDLIKVNVRVVLATHRNLEDLVKQNAFRRDLFHRIYVFPLTLPPLRERPEDFPGLVAHFARSEERRVGKECRSGLWP